MFKSCQRCCCYRRSRCFCCNLCFTPSVEDVNVGGNALPDDHKAKEKHVPVLLWRLKEIVTQHKIVVWFLEKNKILFRTNAGLNTTAIKNNNLHFYDLGHKRGINLMEAPIDWVKLTPRQTTAYLSSVWHFCQKLEKKLKARVYILKKTKSTIASLKIHFYHLKIINSQYQKIHNIPIGLSNTSKPTIKKNCHIKKNFNSHLAAYLPIYFTRYKQTTMKDCRTEEILEANCNAKVHTWMKKSGVKCCLRHRRSDKCWNMAGILGALSW